MATFTAEIDVSIEEFLNELNHDEKVELFERVLEQLNKDVNREVEKLEHDVAANKRSIMIDNFRNLAPFEQRKFLVDALYVSNDYDDDALKGALEPIITAR